MACDKGSYAHNTDTDWQSLKIGLSFPHLQLLNMIHIALGRYTGGDQVGF